MAKDKKPSTCFLSCFGLSKARARPTVTRSDIDDEKPRRQLPLPRFWAKKPGAKTVPVDAAATIDVDVKSEKAEAKRRYDESRLRLKMEARRSKSPEKLIGSKRLAAVPAASDQDKPPPRELSVQQIRTAVPAEQNPVPEKRSDQPVPDPNGSAQPQSQRRLPFRRKIDSLKPGTGGSSQPGSPLLRTRPGPISRSASFPLPPRKKLKQCSGGVSRNLDPIVGMSIVMVTLIIMVLWGRLCAVLCTCAWFYFGPRIRPISRSYRGEGADPDPDPDPIGSDLGSGEYKKRVVLEGLLERDRRSSLAERRATAWHFR